MLRTFSKQIQAKGKDETVHEHWTFDKLKLLGNGTGFGDKLQLFTKNPGSLRDGIGLMVETSHLRVIGLFGGNVSWLWFGFEFF